MTVTSRFLLEEALENAREWENKNLIEYLLYF